MEFKSLKNIETSFRQIRLFGIVFIALCALVAVFSVGSAEYELLREFETPLLLR